MASWAKKMACGLERVAAHFMTMLQEAASLHPKYTLTNLAEFGRGAILSSGQEISEDKVKKYVNWAPGQGACLGPRSTKNSR